jgi:hypothetical protein
LVSSILVEFAQSQAIQSGKAGGDAYMQPGMLVARA